MAPADYLHDKPVLETGRLILRPLNAGDVPALREWMPDRSLYTYWGKGPGRAERNPELLFVKPEKAVKSLHLGIALRETGRVAGDIWVYLVENNRMAAVAARLSRAFQGRGLGTESLAAMTEFCFTRTELRRLRAQVDVRNTASCRMLEKCGYTREGRIRQGKMVSVWCDCCIYGILAADMKARGAGGK